MRYKIVRGNTSHQCAWVVLFAPRIRNFEPIAEFWDRKDAQLFLKAKRNLPKVRKE